MPLAAIQHLRKMSQGYSGRSAAYCQARCARQPRCRAQVRTPPNVAACAHPPSLGTGGRYIWIERKDWPEPHGYPICANDETKLECPTLSDPNFDFGNAYYNDHHFHYGCAFQKSFVSYRFVVSCAFYIVCWCARVFNFFTLWVCGVCVHSTYGLQRTQSPNTNKSLCMQTLTEGPKSLRRRKKTFIL